MTRTISYTEELTVMVCWCGMHHAVPTGLRDHQLRCHNDGRQQIPDIFCPLGHTHIPSGTPKYMIERDARQAAEARTKALEDQLSAANREAKRIAKRAKQGVCPCCHRSFVNVKRHMDGQHPGYEG